MHDEGRVVFDGLLSLPKYQFFIADHLGNNRVIIERIDASTALVQETHYGAWGEVLEGIGQAGNWNFLFQGKEFIDGVGYDFHSRSYDAWTGRFDQIDGANQFASGFVGMGNMPNMGIDPDGQVWFVYAGAALIGGVSNLASNWHKAKNWKQGLAYFGSGAVGGALSVNGGPVAGGTTTAALNLVIDATTGNIPSFKNGWDVAKYTGGLALDGFGVSGAGSLSKLGFSKLGMYFSEAAIASSLGTITKIGSVPGEITSEIAELIVQPAVKGWSTLAGQVGKQGVNLADDAGRVGINPNEIRRIQNAANKINKDIYVVGSRAKGTANKMSDWDYVIEGMKNSEWKKVRNSLPGSSSKANDLPRMIDIFRDLDITKPFLKISPK